MLILVHVCSVCKVWGEKTSAEIGSEVEGPCPRCAAIHSFRQKETAVVWMLDSDIANNWQFGWWGRIKLSWKEVSILIGECSKCGCKIKVIPSFMVKGTRLTLEALCLVTVAKEVSGLSWRNLRDLLCDGVDGWCAHSTLYEAVHRVGKFLAESKEELFELCRQLQPPPELTVLKTESTEDGFCAPSARLDHTLAREMGARCLVSGLVAEGRSRLSKFIGFFFDHLRRWSLVWSVWRKPIPLLYQRRVLDST